MGGGGRNLVNPLFLRYVLEVGLCYLIITLALLSERGPDCNGRRGKQARRRSTPRMGTVFLYTIEEKEGNPERLVGTQEQVPLPLPLPTLL